MSAGKAAAAAAVVPKLDAVLTELDHLQQAVSGGGAQHPALVAQRLQSTADALHALDDNVDALQGFEVPAMLLEAVDAGKDVGLCYKELFHETAWQAQV